MNDQISFKRFLYGDGMEMTINDEDFCIDRTLMLPKIHPHKLEKALSISAKYCQAADFRRKMIKKSNECPVLIYKLYKRRVLGFEEIEPFLRSNGSFLLSYYFWKEISDFTCLISKKYKPFGIDESFFENTNEIDQLIEYGYHPSSIEYCLKYDIVDDFKNINDLFQEAKWSPFEWSLKPENLDLFSFSGFFGSIKCFKHFLMNGARVNDNALSNVICSGCLDLFHLCNVIPMNSQCLCKASMYFQLPLLVFYLENGADLHIRDRYVLHSNSKLLPSIMLHKMAILVSLSI